jgi:electron transport complex protein RnfC
VDRSLTVSGGACKTPKNTVVPVGTLPSELIASGFIQYDEDTLRKILFGGPMMGFAVPNLDIPIQKNNNGLILMTAAETTAYKEGTCIRCGRCLAHCPMRLSPVLMNEALTAAEEDEKAFDEAAALGLMDCIECGACSYICPARIRLTQRFRVGKGRLRARPKK